ncbi:MAG: hypothetical protein KBB04_14195, partial [Methanothrix sp.]|uniref:hypothetical protein n=1 Tax=Methanothrix sp. TaxID=90426 RepID=UPI001B5F541E
RLGDTGPIIISHEEITCCYLVKSKSVLVTDISANFTAKMIRYRHLSRKVMFSLYLRLRLRPLQSILLLGLFLRSLDGPAPQTKN